MIFKTRRLKVRKLKIEDLQSFFELESNPEVLQYATGEVKNNEECEKELKELINKYEKRENNFWIYAIISNVENHFIGTLALVKDDNDDDEIGYRFIQRFWGNGYATEICEGLIDYCKSIGMKKIVGNVVNENVASAKILEKFNFVKVKNFISKDIGLPETKYELHL